MTPVRMCRLLVLIGVLKFCGAEEPKCSTVFSGTTTAYTIHEDHKYSQNTDDECDFSWYDSKDKVFANQETSSALVKNWSINHLTVEGCEPALFLKRNCIAEREEFTANCSASCDDFPKLPEDIVNPSNSTHVDYVNHVAVPVTAVLIIAIIVGILYMKRKKVFRNGSCGQMGGIYSGVKTDNTNSNVV